MKLQFFKTPEGYVDPVTNTLQSVASFSKETGTTSYSDYNYVYQYKDHLGNVRLSYADSDLDGVASENEIIVEDNYYPFGGRQKGYNNVVSSNGNALAQNYKYNGKELNQELGLNTYDYGARNYDSWLGRWSNVDPLAANYLSFSPYHYSYNNPIRFIDPDGRKIVDKNGNEVGVTINEDEDGNKSASYTFAEGTKKSVIRKFNRNAGRVINSMINSDKGEELVNEAIESKDHISINLSSSTKNDRMGVMNPTTDVYNMDGENYQEIEITIYTGTIDLMMESNKTGETITSDKRTQEKMDSWKENSLTRGQVIGSVGGHEIYHALHHTNGPINQDQHDEAHDAEGIIVKEFGIKNKKDD